MAADSLKPQSRDESPLMSDESGISAEDRAELLKSIENIASENHISLDGRENSALKEAKSGIAFPILVNLLSIVVVGVVIFFLGQSFQNDTSTLVRSGIEFSSLEGQLIRELQKESQVQISAKNQEITGYETRLSDLEGRLSELDAEIDGKLNVRESEYNQQFAVALEDERNRLVASGIDPDEVERLLQIQEDELRTYYSGLLSNYESELFQERNSVQDNITNLRQEYAQELEQLKVERDGIIESFKAREISLRSELEQQSQVVVDQSSEALGNLRTAREELALLEQEQQNADAVESQLLGLYERLQASLNQNRLEDSLDIVQQARTFLNESRIIALASLSSRRSADLFIIATIERYIEDTIQGEESLNSVSGQLEILSRIQLNNERASSAIANNNNALAVNIYGETMSLMPELQTANVALVDNAVDNARNLLNEQFQEELDLRSETIAGLVRSADNAIGQGNYTLALNNFDQALQTVQELENNGQSINSSLLSMGYDLADAVVRSENSAAVNTILRRVGANSNATINFISGQIDEAVRAREEVLLTEIAQAGDAISSLQAQNLDAVNEVSSDLTDTFSAEIGALTGEVDTLNAEISALNAEVSGLNDALSATEARRIELQVLSDGYQQEVARLQDFEEKLNTIQSRYSGYKVNADALQGASAVDGFALRTELENFIGSPELEDIFPDLRTAIRFNYAFSEDAGRVDGLNLAKDVVTGFSGQASPDQRRLYLETELDYAREDNDGVMEAFLIDLLGAIQ